MTTREFFLSATFTAGLMFIVSLVVLAIGIVYGSVTPLFYAVSAGLLVSPLSLLFKKRKIILPMVLGVNYEFRLGTVIQWITVSITLPFAMFPAKTIMQVSAYGLYFILNLVILLSMLATKIKVEDENYTSFYKK